MASVIVLEQQRPHVDDGLARRLDGPQLHLGDRHQALIRQVILPAPQPLPEVPATSEDIGDWVVDLVEWTQVNTKTEACRRIRRSVITGPRTT